MRVVRYTAMSRAARAMLAAGLALALLLAGADTWRRLASVDPRGRAAWTAAPVVVRDSAVDVTVFLPACDVAAITLHPQSSAAGTLWVDLLHEGTHDAFPTRVGGATVRVRGVAPVHVPVPEVRDAWRRPLTLRMRAVGEEGVPRTAAQPIALDAVRPVSLVFAPPEPAGTLACAFDSGNSALSALVGVLLFGGLAGYACLATALIAPARTPARGVCWAAALLTGSTTLIYVLLVPPFEAPDELAHFQYARLVAETGHPPAEVPPVTSEWRASSYEWVQQPLYYVGAAGLLRALRLHTPAPALQLNPRSRLQGGSEPVIFHRGRPPDPSHGHTGLMALRGVSLLMAMSTALVVTQLVMSVTAHATVALLAGASLGLVPQWCAVMGSVSTDPPATLLAALATFAVAAVARGRTSTAWLLLTGVLIGAAYGVKATTVFLVPMAVLACLVSAPRGWREALRRLLIVGAGSALAAGWIPVRAWLVFGDPRAAAFKRAVLEAAGFVPAGGPMPWTADFWRQMQTMVFEPFWARFGSLGAGPFPGARVWLVYAAASGALMLLAALGTATAWRTRHERDRHVPWLCAAGAIAGLGAWVVVNLLPQADMVVHWTPRHVLPLTAPMAVLIATGVCRVQQCGRTPARMVGLVLGLMVLALAVAHLAVFRATVLMFHFGY